MVMRPVRAEALFWATEYGNDDRNPVPGVSELENVNHDTLLDASQSMLQPGR